MARRPTPAPLPSGPLTTEAGRAAALAVAAPDQGTAEGGPEGLQEVPETLDLDVIRVAAGGSLEAAALVISNRI